VGRGIGRALEKAIAHEEGGATPGARGSLLMHPQRRELFRLLCLRPCSTAGELSRQSGASPNAVRYHLERLTAAKLVVRGAGATYSPRGFIDPADGAVFRALAEGSTRKIYRTVMEAPGSTQRELAESLGVSRQAVFKSTNLLETQGLLTSIEDGRFRRCYPTDLLARRREANRARAKSFADVLLKELVSEGLTPQILRRTDRGILTRIARGRTSETLDLSLDPFTTVLE